MQTETRVRSIPASTLFHKFDEEYGYGRWSRVCQDSLKRALPADADSDFRTKGVEILRLFSPAEMGKVLGYVKQHENAAQSIYANEDYITHVVLSKKDYLRMLFAKIFTKEMDRRMAAFFQSEYLVMWFSFCRTVANATLTDSFLWHKDAGPSMHAKIILYLNGTAEHGARTDFIDSESTARLGAAGYDFVAIEDRRDTLDPFVERAGIEFKPRSPIVEPGEAILFKAGHVLHRGVFPTRGPRYTLTLCLLPSPKTWREHFETCDMRRMQTVEATPWEEAPWKTAGMTI